MVSVIILSYNTKDLTKACLESLFTHVKHTPFEVIVADNASEDGSAESIKKEFPKVRVFENTENLGFAKGINRAVKQARGDTLLFLNSDTRFTEDSLHEMADFLKKNADIGIVGGKMKNPDGSDQRSCGKFPTLFAVASMLFGGDRAELKQVRTDQVQPVDWVSGGFMLVKKEVFEKLGGFDEHFFMYIEDMELCYRANKHDIGVYYYPKASVIHKSYGSSNRTFAIVNIYKGIKYFYRKHYSPVLYILLSIMLAVKAFLSIGVGILTWRPGLVGTYIKALRS